MVGAGGGVVELEGVMTIAARLSLPMPGRCVGVVVVL